MSSPAQIVIVEGGEHWVAWDKGQGALGGECVLFVSSPHEMDRYKDWYDRRWNRGPDAVYLVDHDRRVLLFSFIYTYDLPDAQAYRAMLLRLVRHMWKGWRVDWAYNGVEDVVAHLGLDVSVLGPDPGRPRPRPRRPALHHRRPDDQNHCLVTVDDGSAVRAYGVTPASDELLGLGPQLLERLPEEARLVACESVPRAGLHVDLPTRTGGYWTQGFIHGALYEASRTWPGWRWDFWEDDYTVQRARAGGAVTIPDPDVGTAITDFVTRRARLLGWDAELARSLLPEVLAEPDDERRIAALADFIQVMPY
ncbi:hypothetical protein E1293_42935 [Actinomadura darangshiensis]|uniref:Uncharacterized protein n=1 Tax=Actinomadura darangshiensis TaxID=705336 RepID=A0A4R4ZYX5_9ACTN|nr:hypothetical protein [Actinomadura darangshiensis]TDD63584.1 hypothetical protein E1293_42935 [Actinomadura darangshiensis]